jgi:hypothetical protein
MSHRGFRLSRKSKLTDTAVGQPRLGVRLLAGFFSLGSLRQVRSKTFQLLQCIRAVNNQLLISTHSFILEHDATHLNAFAWACHSLPISTLIFTHL